MMEKLFHEFKGVDLDAWVDKIHADLKGKPKDLLAYKPELELDVKSFYHRSEIPHGNYSIGKKSNHWNNRRAYTKATNAELLHDLNEGIDCLGLEFSSQSIFDQLVDNVQFKYISSDIQFFAPDSALSFKGHPSSILNFDIFGLGVKSGKSIFEKSDFLAFVRTQANHRTIWVSGSFYGEAGASTVQELAFTANHLNEYVQLLVDGGMSLSDINKRVVIELSITDDYFVNIAKLKTLRHLVRLIFSAYDPSYAVQEFRIYAKTSSRYLAENDSNNNYLRQTTQTMSALIGGCDVITIQPLLSSDPKTNELRERMAKNIPLILKEESYLDKVADVAEGSYYVEDLINQISEQAWDLFKEIENLGGLWAAIEANHIQNLIQKNRDYIIERVNAGEKTFLGVNKFPSTLESWVDPKRLNSDKEVTFIPLTTFKVEEHFKKKNHGQSKV